MPVGLVALTTFLLLLYSKYNLSGHAQHDGVFARFGVATAAATGDPDAVEFIILVCSL